MHDWFRLWFWCNCCNDVAMFLGSVLTRDIHPSKNIQNGRCSGGVCLMNHGMAAVKVF